MKFFAFLSCFVFLVISVSAQISLAENIPTPLNQKVYPSDHARLNRTEILFNIPFSPEMQNYRIQVISSDGNFMNDLLLDVESPLHRLVLDKFEWGKDYAWRYLDKDGNWSSIRYFSILAHPFWGDEKARLKVMRHEEHAGNTYLLDAARSAINSEGQSTWFLPLIPGSSWADPKTEIRDLKFTPRNTVTFLVGEEAFEVDLSGKVIWQGRAYLDGQDTKEKYHHELRLLPSGNYLVASEDIEQRIDPVSGERFDVPFGTILILTPENEVVFKWSSADYFTEEDLWTRKKPDGSPDYLTHLNSVQLESGKFIAGFRDISRIIVIDSATGMVEQSFGRYYGGAEPGYRVDFFRRQHGGGVAEGGILILNNDSVADPGIVSSVLIFSVPEKEKEQARKIWEFPFDFDTLTNGKSMRTGTAWQLEDGSILIGMGVINRFVRVNRKKEILWDAFAEQYDLNTKEWIPLPSYRISKPGSFYNNIPVIQHSYKENTFTFGGEEKLELSIGNAGKEKGVFEVFLEPDDKAFLFNAGSWEIDAGESIRVSMKLPKRFKQNNAFKVILKPLDYPLTEQSTLLKIKQP